MAKLHEILAVESSQEKTANNLLIESIKTLDKESLFSGQVRRLIMFREEDKKSETEEHQELTTTVDENIQYLKQFVSEYWDTVLQKDKANTEAVADLEIGGKTIATALPATFLLGLENKLAKLRAIYEQIPTLPPGRKWIPDETHAKKGVFQDANSASQLKTKKDPEFVTVAEATKEHPAQVVQIDRTVDIGRYETTVWSGKLTPQDKADRLARLTELMQAVKRARTRANAVEAPARENIGAPLFDYINKGVL